MVTCQFLYLATYGAFMESVGSLYRSRLDNSRMVDWSSDFLARALSVRAIADEEGAIL